MSAANRAEWFGIEDIRRITTFGLMRPTVKGFGFYVRFVGAVEPSGVPFSLVTFSWANKRKQPAQPGRKKGQGQAKTSNPPNQGGTNSRDSPRPRDSPAQAANAWARTDQARNGNPSDMPPKVREKAAATRFPP